WGLLLAIISVYAYFNSTSFQRKAFFRQLNRWEDDYRSAAPTPDAIESLALAKLDLLKKEIAPYALSDLRGQFLIAYSQLYLVYCCKGDTAKMQAYGSKMNRYISDAILSNGKDEIYKIKLRYLKRTQTNLQRFLKDSCNCPELESRP
ncbi:MAG: hypothetical protein AB1921_16450, partial [Thermodesulfobacteriota bacterium]